MPIRPSERSRYPVDWPAIVQRIRARAGDRCEFTRADGSRCGAPNHETIARSTGDPEQWYTAGEACKFLPDSAYRLVAIVLTVAHLNHQPEDCRDENLRAGCQLHHLRHDQAHHQQNAAATRRARKGNGELFTNG